MRTWGKVVHPGYMAGIDAITVEDVQDAVSKALDSKPTYVTHGGDVGGLMSLAEIERKFR